MNFVQPIREPEKIDAIEEILKSQNYRDYVIWLVGIYAGLRCGDILNLRVKDVRGQTHLEIEEQKTGKIKRIKIHRKLKEAVQQYTKGRADYEMLFRSREGKNRALTTTRVYQIIRQAAEKAGIRYPVGTHSMRKTFGYWFYERYRRNTSKGPVFALAFLKEWFGHSSEDVTARYIGLTQDIFDRAIDGLQIGTRPARSERKRKEFEEIDS